MPLLIWYFKVHFQARRRIIKLIAWLVSTRKQMPVCHISGNRVKKNCNGQRFCVCFVVVFCLLDFVVLTLGCLRAPLLKYDLFRRTLLYMIMLEYVFVKAYTCYRLTTVAVILVNSELSLLNFSFDVIFAKRKVRLVLSSV